MASFNSCTFVGNLGKDPELRYTPNGKAVCNFNIAVNAGWGEKKTTWWCRVTVWDKAGENAANYLKKGQPVLVSGELSITDFETRDGGKGKSIELTARSVVFLGGQSSDQRDTVGPDGNTPRGRSQQSRRGGGGRGEPPPDVEDDDIPF